MIKTREEQIDEAFSKFHAENPVVWELFERFSLEVARSGMKHFSSEMIINRMRWFTDVETVGGQGVKINNNFKPCYARMFHEKHPEYNGFFRNRIRASSKQPAYERDIQVWLGEDEK